MIVFVIIPQDPQEILHIEDRTWIEGSKKQGGYAGRNAPKVHQSRKRHTDKNRYRRRDLRK